MISLDLPAPVLWAVRWLLFLGPLAAASLLAFRVRADRRALVAGLFAFLYGLGAVFAAHRLAIALGWWRYGGDALMLQGVPADVWLGGALLFGPVLHLAFPRVSPLLLTLPVVIGLHGLFFASLPPLVYPGPNWFLGVLVVFATAHIPALYLARWTAGGRRLAERAALLAVAHGLLAFGVLPCLILRAMGGRWDLLDRPAWLLGACAVAAAPLVVMGLSAVQFFATYGGGTALPLDPTERLVRGGVFAYVTNPMQLCTAASWLVMGVALASVWVAAAAAMAWVFVLGMVRWHHRHDLLVRYPEGWPAYRAHVPEWIPRWRPWVPEPACLTVDATVRWQARFGRWIERSGAVGLRVDRAPGGPLCYADAAMILEGPLGALRAMQHVNFACALVGAAGLLAVWPLAGLRRRRRAWLRRFGLARLA